MSKINAVRIINLNYNNNAIKISDEIFEMDGESTLLSLQNGGGKSVLVQMMLAPFVHKRYQNAKDRPFASYFTTNKPTFLMVEWKLDGGAGYVLTGMMVRKSQEIAEENANELEVINFVSEYKNRCNQDIYHLAVVEKTKKEMVLKSFSACRQLFETCKRERQVPFYYYDMNNSAQQRQYFDKLMEYQINYREWENIVKKINLKESGLSDLFQDCKDEKGLVEKWFLDSVEQKLNKEKDRMQEFQSITEKYVSQYRENKAKIKRRDGILSFQNKAEQIEAENAVYQEFTQKKENQEKKIADFIYQLNALLGAEQESNSKIEAQIQNLLQEMEHLEYEKISSEIYDIIKEMNILSSNQNMLQMEKDDLEQELNKITEKLHIFQCAKQQELVNENSREYELWNQKLKVCQEENQDLEPERKRLGGQLKQYYSKLCDQEKNKVRQMEEELTNLEQNLQAEQKKTEELIQEEKKIVKAIGGISSKIEDYDRTEERYNQKYQTSLGRNILGKYEPGILEISRQEYEKQENQLKSAFARTKKELEEKKEQKKVLVRNLQDIENEKTRTKAEEKTSRGVLAEYEKELEERRVILHYFQLEEKQLFQREEILEQAERKIKETQIARRALENEENMLQKEYNKLTQGEILELSEEFKKMLEEAGITPIYGMEWLLKNRKSEEENRQLIERHPFLPYALIMTKQEIVRLKEQKENIYTSFPVPILMRESLENTDEPTAKSAILKLQGVSFYVWFNENLLDEEKLAVMVQEKGQQIQKVRNNLERKNAEYKEYIEKKEKIRNQKVNQEVYEGVQKNLEKLLEKISDLEKELTQKRQQEQKLEQSMLVCERKIAELEKTIRSLQQQRLDFAELEKAYLEYEENKNQLEKKKLEQERLENLQRLSKDLQEKLMEKRESSKNEKVIVERQLEEHQQAKLKYTPYEEELQTKPLEAAKLDQAENRFLAITSKITEEKQDLENQVERAYKRYEASKQEVLNLQKKFQLDSKQWENCIYDAKEERHQEVEQEDRQRKIKGKDSQLTEMKVKIGQQQAHEKHSRKKLIERCHTEILLPKEEIRIMAFDGEIQTRTYQKKELEQQQSRVQKRILGYEELLTALAEYNEIPYEEGVEWNINLASLTQKELVEQKGMMIRDYNQYGASIQEKRGNLDRLLGTISREQEFLDEFYQKPLEALMRLTDSPVLVQKQLETILQSFQSLMEKLLVDISVVEKEKATVAALMEDYLKEVHNDLGKIDHNSTIIIREKPIKMLKIELPNWQENESMYHLRLQDYIDDVTLKGVAILEENENIGEFLGTRITTNALYDTVVGISNVQIRMYKIESQREYPISWSDVAKNSGGEGFLSAFVILSSLLYYMRRDESDIFADRNEGKVLIMDNPFAQTNAAHLLRPLMDMAKKTNTQLICLSGLGGESIYNCFDNIYVLNLIAANLRSGMQYLKADHMRGSEEETMIVSQIEVKEQQELVF